MEGFIMVLDSSVFPLSAGSSNIAGFTWEEKTTDFTATSNKAYYCDTALDNILLTLSSLPNNGDEIGLLIIGNNKVRIATTDKVKGNLLQTDYVKEIGENYLLIILTYVDATTGWDWDTRYNSYISDKYVGAASYYPYVSSPTVVAGVMTRDADNADIFWNLGTVDQTEAWQHPATSRGLITVTQSGVRDNNADPTYWGHNIIDNNTNISDIGATWFNNFSAQPNGHWVQLQFIGKQVSIEQYWLYESSVNNFSGIDIFGSNDGTNWTLIHAPTISGTPYLSPTLSNIPYYTYIRLWDQGTTQKVVQITEFCAWGYVQ